MSWLQSFESEDKGVEKALSGPIGAASPLWWAFAGVASAGVAYWWMTRWAKPFNLEAETPLPTLVEPVLVETVEVIEATVEAAAEATIEVLEAVTEPQVLAEPEPVVAEAEAVAAAEPEPVVEAVEAAADDLTLLVGIGPKLAVSLAERGVTRFAQIADWGEADLARFDKDLSLKGRAVRDAWVAQAKRFVASPVALPE